MFQSLRAIWYCTLLPTLYKTIFDCNYYYFFDFNHQTKETYFPLLYLYFLYYHKNLHYSFLTFSDIKIFAFFFSFYYYLFNPIIVQNKHTKLPIFESAKTKKRHNNTYNKETTRVFCSTLFSVPILILRSIFALKKLRTIQLKPEIEDSNQSFNPLMVRVRK